LRGCGDSSKPDGGGDHVNYSKRAMAIDQVEVMAALGFDRFAFVGHDRGARVGHRLALDHPVRVTKLALLFICPTLHMYNTANRAFATFYFHWLFLIQPEPFPETLIGANAEAVLKQFMGAVQGIEPQALAEYLRCFSDPATIHATCEDYRAAATIDLAHDEADLDEKIACPLLVLLGCTGPRRADVRRAGRMAGARRQRLRSCPSLRSLVASGGAERDARGAASISDRLIERTPANRREL
jgi:haloacetate dehalogenase